MRTEKILDYLRNKNNIDQEYTMLNLPQSEEEYNQNVKWIVGVDENRSAIYGGQRPITWSQIVAAEAEAEVAVAMDALRQERNKRISETDWWALGDNQITEDRRIYRQRLRDITDNASPRLDQNNNLIMDSVQWPTKPD
jgi:hypothetical protein